MADGRGLIDAFNKRWFIFFMGSKVYVAGPYDVKNFRHSTNGGAAAAEERLNYLAQSASEKLENIGHRPFPGRVVLAQFYREKDLDKRVLLCGNVREWLFECDAVVFCHDSSISLPEIGQLELEISKRIGIPSIFCSDLEFIERLAREGVKSWTRDTTCKDESACFEQIRQYSWNWFSYHANQRYSSFNYFLAAAVILFTGYATAAKEELWWLAAAIGVIGTIIGLLFIKLDQRNAFLVKLGEKGLLASERVLFGLHRTPVNTSTSMVLGHPFPRGILSPDEEKDEAARNRSDWDKRRDKLCRGKHSIYFPLIQGIVAFVFFVGLIVAVIALFSPELFRSGTASKERVQEIHYYDLDN
ncbi:MAG: hypothetical protein QNJ97_08715 [Myxococcota bacterium]|nr:hypothetical protein [Myxococcota bacterium]